jgi:hypothetical protein
VALAPNRSPMASRLEALLRMASIFRQKPTGSRAARGKDRGKLKSLSANLFFKSNT